MSAADQPTETAPADVAAELHGQGLVRLVAAPDGDALAATGLLGRALATIDVPFHAGIRRLPDPGATDADRTLGIGHACGDLALTDRSTSAAAYAVATELEAAPDPVLALAGVTAAGALPGDEDSGALAAAEERSLVERRPGVALPVADLADGLAHTALIHAPFSGDVEAAQATLMELDLPATPDEDAHRRLASLVALEVVDGDDVPPRAADAVERALRPYATESPFETVGGYADVLDLVAREQPGTGVALALGHGNRTDALDAWRSHASDAHTALRAADMTRHRGLVAARIDDGPVETVARLLRDYRSPEPVAVVATEGAAAVATVDRDARRLACDAASAAGGVGAGRGTLGYATVEDADAFVDAVREAL